MSPTGRILIVLILHFQHAQTELTCKITQKQLLVVGVVNEDISIQCEYKCKSTNRSVPLESGIPVIMSLYKETPEIIIQMSKKDSRFMSKVNKAWRLTVTDMSDSGIYYCQGHDPSKTFKGTGTLLQVKVAVTQDPNYRVTEHVLQGISSLLMVYSLTITATLLHKNKTCSRWKPNWMKPLSRNFPRPSTTNQSNTAGTGRLVVESPGNENTYTALQRTQASIYNSLQIEGRTPDALQGQHAEVGSEVYECVYETF
ncbi:NFAT activation molecule 1-like [Narcine bancroftii]|uniref:NFAT activation molecule 1-like n=1 Tax=Narcine bancroftii TaxID=1343680 RepID=UPI0038318FB3